MTVNSYNLVFNKFVTSTATLTLRNMSYQTHIQLSIIVSGIVENQDLHLGTRKPGTLTPETQDSTTLRTGTRDLRNLRPRTWYPRAWDPGPLEHGTLTPRILELEPWDMGP